MLNWVTNMAALPGTTLWLIWITTFCLATVSIATNDGLNFDLSKLHFTQSQYNASVPENSLGKTFVTPASKMGIYVSENAQVKVTYQIVNHDDDLFKVEDHLVGDFSFLLIRTHSNSYGRLNREFRSEYQLTIKAILESDSLAYETSTHVIVYISDLNDLQPLFDHSFYNLTVSEDTVLHTSVGKVAAYDGDAGINAEIYYSFAQGTNTFAIHPTSGVITLTRPLNFFLQKVYTLEVLAYDRGPQYQESMVRKRPATVQVNLKQVNFFPPDISVKKLPNVIEPGQNEIVLAMVNVKDSDMGANGKIHSVQITEGSQGGLISLQKGEQEGDFRVVLLPSDHLTVPTPGFNITLSATDQGDPPLSANETIYISVYDTKVIPKFSKSVFNVSIEEIALFNSPVTFVSTQFSANTFDVRFEIVDGNKDNLFKINQISGLISTSAKLDAEKVQNVQLRVMVYDAVQKRHRNSDTCTVNITVIDNNDNAPQFQIDDSVSEIYILENLPAGSSIFTINAVDKDQGDNGKISYSITNVHSVPFEIEPFTGVIRSTKLLDYETMRHSYKMNIRVSDWGTPYPRENEMLFTINLQDTNDNEPRFEKKDCVGYIAKETPVNAEVVVVPAIDFDVYDIIQYYIINGNLNNCFKIERELARISLNCSLADVTDEKFMLTIMAKDGLHESETMQVEINVVDQADKALQGEMVKVDCQQTEVYKSLQEIVTIQHQNNEATEFGLVEKTESKLFNIAPEFNDTVPSYFEISEGLKVGTVLANFGAYDPDSGYNGTLVYVIRNGDLGGSFKIDMHTGDLIVMSELNREVRDEYNLVIEVSDLGKPALSANATIKIKILDENDNAPKFEQDVYHVTISENINMNVTITQVTAMDVDLGKNAEIRYTIVSDTDHFSINSLNGMIVTNRPLDREQHAVYTVLVRASDIGEDKTSLSSTATVLVELTDVNDVVPQFTPDLYSVRIREDLPVGSVITVVTAADKDEGKFGQVQYQLVYGVDYFDIDSETGVIRIKKSLDYETQQVHNISVRAQDGGVPPLVSVCFINIEVVDVNENLLAPVFESFYAHGYISENEPMGTTVMFVRAYDPDGDGITYSIRDGTGLGRFAIDSNGTITTRQVLDRETASHYWLTVYAQDHGLVPLHTWMEVYVEVMDTNDHIPLTYEPVYYGTVPENANTGFVTQIQAFDHDLNLNQSLRFAITRYNDDNYFKIDSITGVITTTGKSFDREEQALHHFEVTVSDQGEPPLTYQMYVFVRVEDENDNRPQFSERSYRIQVPETKFSGLDIPVFQVLAWDDDAGPNAELSFDIRKDDSSIFMIDSITGMIYATDDLKFGEIHFFVVRATDNGSPKSRRNTVKIRIEVIERQKRSRHAPKFAARSFQKSVMEDDRVGHLVDLFQATDRDNDDLFYYIIGGDPQHQFYIGHNAGNLMVARPLNWTQQSSYNLTLQVTDGSNFDQCSVIIHVIDSNDHVPQFTSRHYEGSFPESAPVGSTLVRVKAIDDDNNRLIYTLPSSSNSQTTLQLFTVDAESGAVKVRSPLDHEVATQHNLTVMVSDDSVPVNKNLTRVTINILDHNDHPPAFLAPEFKGRVFETSAVGTSVVQVLAMDQDKGHNAEITYSLLSGNIGSMFDIDPMLGTIFVAKELHRSDQDRFELVVVATDNGIRPLSATATASIEVTISDNAPPKFEDAEYMAELLENEPPFTNVFTVTAICRSSIIYTITAGNDKGVFSINPNSGVVFTKKSVDYEVDQSFNLTIKATSVIHSSASTTLLIHIIDQNDNAPEFLQDEYIGNVTELAQAGSIVLNKDNKPLVILAKDSDSNLNALLTYEIRDDYARDYITIDPNTGAIRTLVEFDHEEMEKIELSVEVWDMGKPQLRTKYPAKVIIYVNDVNDSPPTFSMPNYTADILLPTFKNVIVIQLDASDPDTGVSSKLTYSIVGGNKDNVFGLNKYTGDIYVVKNTDLLDRYKLKVEVSDGLYIGQATVDISVTQPAMEPFSFTSDLYEASVEENHEGVETLTVVQVANRGMNEQYTFTLLNAQGKFEIGRTSGVLTTTGVVFDREEISLYNLVVEVHKMTPAGAVRGHALVRVTVEDENDNSPVFVNQPYHAVLVHDATLGHAVKQVRALDQDAGVYGRVTYTLTGTSDLLNMFTLDPETGLISVFKPLKPADVGREFTLTVTASDGDLHPKTAQTTVKVTVIDSSYPVFEQQVYHASIPEHYPMGSSVASLSANSPTGQKLIYTIVDGDIQGDFNVDFNIGVVTVQGEIDRNPATYTLTLQAAEVNSQLTATALLIVTVQDINNVAPTLDEHFYETEISEAVGIGSPVLTVTATDPEPDLNGLVHYTLLPFETGNTDVDWFHIDSETGEIVTRKFLDREEQDVYKFIVEAADSGVPSLSSTSTVTVNIGDLNDNAPVFDQIAYSCSISDQVARGQLITKVSATDRDSSSAGNLHYAIIGGNNKNTFDMSESNGIILLSEQRIPNLYPAYELNVSVSDNVFTNFARVSIKVATGNHNSPRFTRPIYVAEFPENYGEGMLVMQVSAEDEDEGVYGLITYTIPSDMMRQYFRVDADTGEIFSVQVLDREERSVYNVPVAATDNGGRTAFTTAHISIMDQNDNVPQFLAQEYKLTLLHTTQVNTTVLQIQAEDADSGVNGQIVYTFAPGTASRVQTMFSLHRETGELTLTRSLKDSADEIFQFFIQASDSGPIPMKNDVPVNMWVTDNMDAQPMFSQSAFSFFVPENEPPSTIIATIKAMSTSPLEYIIVPGYTSSSNTPQRFSIDNEGQIRISGPLDMETTFVFTLTIQAQTLSRPPLVQQTTVNIRLMDINDNYPYFESNPYLITVPENLEPGIDLIQVIAHDDDKTSKFTYSFGEDVKKFAHQFDIDSSTGFVTLLSSLDREQQDLYNLTVWVKDSNDEGNALRNSTIITVKVIDHNDNPPMFTRSHYQAAVNEDAYEGTILMTLTTTDKDIPAPYDVHYYIVDGDPEGKFKIRRNGDIFVNRNLDRERTPRYKLVVAATDGAFVSKATVTIDILDANDNSPVCQKPLYEESVSEDVLPTWVIARLKASDADEYGSLRYELSGEGAEHFYLEPNSGVLTAAIKLDREKTPKYQLQAKAIDTGDRYCMMYIYITLDDVNDNAPVFEPIPGPVSVSEGAPVNTLIYRVSATDADLGNGRQIGFSLKTNPDDTFKMDPRSGLLQLAKPLDRETTPMYTLTVQATDKGTPQLTGEIDLQILVLDINDNPPEFEQTTYRASVLESAAIGYYVTRIQATSRDTGENARIAYFIQAGDDQNKFTIEEDTGIIRTAGYLDHETVPGYVLTVRAQDHGDTPLSNTAYVQVNVTDINDNAPVFLQKRYNGKIREDASKGSKIIQVQTADLDSDPVNKQVNFTIQGGDPQHKFDIHPRDGYIIVRNQLDRESVDSYTLEVRAANYHLASFTVVNVEILDANDSPPTFTEENYTLFVQEDKEITSCVFKFEVTDNDLDPNGAPFTFDIISGNSEGVFRVDREGNLCIAGDLNRQVTATYKLEVRVFDAGTPAMFSDVNVEVEVIEESTFSPEVSNMYIGISSYLDEFPGGVIGTLKAVDGDRFDVLTYEVVSENRNLFDIDKNDGRIIAFAGLDSGTYNINISVTDGKYTSFGKVNVDVTTISEEMIANSVTVKLSNLSPEEFIKNHKSNFQKVIKNELNVRMRDVEIINIQPSEDPATPTNNRQRREATANNLDILFAVTKGTEYIARDRLKRKVIKMTSEIESETGVTVVKVFSDICEKDTCTGGECLGYVQFDKDSLVPILTDGGSFVSAKHRYTYECECPNGYIGDNCIDRPGSCADDPCPTYKVCSPHPEHGYQCICPPGFTGRHCEKDASNKCDHTNCHRGDTPITFSGNSYARWSLVDAIDRRLSLSLRVKTMKQTASLMFAKGRVDYSILELVDGKVQYRFDCGSGEGLVLIPNNVSDGKWHTIMVERYGNTAELFLDGQYSAITTAPGINDVLNLDTSDVYFGAEVEKYVNGYVDVRKGFRGCIEDIRIYNVRLPVSGSNAVALSQQFEHVEFSCRDSHFEIDGNNVCSSFPCLNGGKCEPAGTSFICHCQDRYRGARCEIDKDPCQRQPCLNNGMCINVKGVPNDFTCQCEGEFRGRRCEYGRYCSPDRCEHGGTCIEGPNNFSCVCPIAYTGSRCESVQNLCLSSPCQNSGVCVQAGNSYVCNCSGTFSGDHCEDIVLPEISSSSSGIGSDEIIAIAGIAGGLIIVVLVFVLVRIYCRNKHRRHHRGHNVTNGIATDGNEVYLNLLKDDKHQYKAENMLKMDNINNKRKTPPSPQPPPVPDRPASYTPSQRDSINTLNNFDQLRNLNYGSAGDELESNIGNNIPYNTRMQTFTGPRTIASIQPTIPPPPLSDTDSLQKEPWESACQNILQNYISDKHSDKMSKMMPIGTVQPMTHGVPHPLQDNTSLSSLPVSESEDDQQGYHWDTSDWAPERSLPNISELPAVECPDSPGSASPHSNDSNTHISNIEPPDEYTDGYTEGDSYLESEYVGDSEYAEHDMEEPPEMPNYEELLAEQSRLLDDYEMPSNNINVHVHPDYYLPLNSSFTSAEGVPPPEGENWPAPPVYTMNGIDVSVSDSSRTSSSSDDNDSVLHYGFPPTHNNINRLSMITTDSDIGETNRLSGAFTTDSEVNEGEYNRGSTVDNMSDISGLCDIDDSELNNSDSEDENTPLQAQRRHTEV